jgi:signal transduction histidine kinase
MNVAFLKSLQVRVALVFLLVSVAPLGVFGWFAVQTADRAITGAVTSQLENLASEKQELLERWIAERKADLAVVSRAAAVQSLDPKQVDRYLRVVQNQYHVYMRFVVADRAGRVVVDLGGESATDSPSLPIAAINELLKATGDEKTHVSAVQWNERTREAVFQIVEMIRDDRGGVAGAVCATVSTQAILGSVLRISLGQTGECYLVDRAGTFLAHQEPQRILKDNIAQSDSVSSLFGRSQPRPIYNDYRGIPVLGASRAVRGTEWFVVVEQDRDEALAGSHLMVRSIEFVLGATVVGVIVLSWLFASYLTRPVRLLTEAAESLSRGDYQTALRGDPRRRSDELGTLDRVFHRMANQIFERETKMEHRIGFTEEELRKSEMRLKETIEAAARAEHLAALGRLAAGVAHEIRTPLASLKLFFQSLYEESDLTPDQSEDFDVAMRQVHRMETTINHFLQFARPQEPHLTDVDFRKLIDETLAMVKPRAHHQNVDVAMSIAAELPRVRGDMHLLSEAMLNLLVNGLEVMPDGGRLSVAVAIEEPTDGAAWRRGVRVEVSDTGPGIAAADLDRVFEPFFTTKAFGSGLGLAAVQSTVAQHGGVVSVRTNAKTGTTFVILLPEAVDL